MEPILFSGGARTVSALLGGSVQMVFGSDVAVTQGILQGIPLTRLGTTMNSLGYFLVTRPEIQTSRDLKGKTLGISRGRDASYARLVKLLRDTSRIQYVTAMSYLYEEIAARVEKGLRPKPESVRFIYELVAAEDPRAKQLGEQDHWDLSLIDEIRQSGFLDQLYRK